MAAFFQIFRYRRLRRSPNPLLFAGLSALGLLAPVSGVLAQSAFPVDADSLAAEFQAALRGVGWRAAVSRLHPEALEYFHHRITLLVEMDTTRGPIEKLYPQGGLPTYHQRSPQEVFLRVMEVLTTDAPGLIHALVVRDVEVIGHVPEGEFAHVVYRSTADLSGARPELRLMTLKRHGEHWRVLNAQEVEVLVEAFRGISRKVRPPPGGWPGGVPPDTGRAGSQSDTRPPSSQPVRQ